MNPFFVGFRAGRRRARAGDGPQHQPGESTFQLVLLEAGWLAGQLLRPSRSLPALLVGGTVATLLAPITPGPVVPGGWRAGIAAAVAILAAATAHIAQGRLSDDAASPGATATVSAAVVALVVSATVVLSRVLAAVTPGATPTGELLGGGLQVDVPLAVGGLLLLAGVLATQVGDRMQVPGSIALLGLGMIVGSDGLGWIEVDDPQLVQGVAVVALVVILFEGGLTTRPRSLRGALAPGLLLATVGVAVTAGVVAAVGLLLLDLPARTAWLLAAIVASTDAAAVFAALRRTPLPRRLASILQVESGTNDPVAVLLTVAFLTATDVGGTTTTWLGFGLTQLVLGGALGLTMGRLGAWLLGRVHGSTVLPVLALSIGGATYGLTAVAGGSGFLAVYVCGITLAAWTPRARRALRSFHEALASSVEVGLFLLLGLLVFPSSLPAAAWAGIVVTAALLLVARPLAVGLTLAPMGLSGREMAAVSWLGIRGAVPIVLATVAFSAGFEEAEWLLDVVFVIVLVSTLVQGTTASAVIRRLGLETPAGPGDSIVDASPFEGLDGELVEVHVTPGSALERRRLTDVPPPGGALVIAVVRGSRLLVPRGTTVFQQGDLLVIAADTADAATQLRAWAGVPATRVLSDT